MISMEASRQCNPRVMKLTSIKCIIYQNSSNNKCCVYISKQFYAFNFNEHVSR